MYNVCVWEGGGGGGQKEGEGGRRDEYAESSLQLRGIRQAYKLESAVKELV
jgi:hypothetical protein